MLEVQTQSVVKNLNCHFATFITLLTQVVHCGDSNQGVTCSIQFNELMWFSSPDTGKNNSLLFEYSFQAKHGKYNTQPDSGQHSKFCNIYVHMIKV